jgi:uncharacterized caspase-like protein
MTASPIDFAASRAILIGTAGHAPGSGLTAMPAALNSLDAMRAVLTGPNCGWPAERVTEFRDRATGDGVHRDVATLIGQATDVALFYYVGHGQLLRGGDDLGMALTDTSTRVELRRATSLRLNDLREDLRYSRARVKLVILDCCFSGIATKNVQGPGNLADQIDRAARVAGTFTLTASRANQAAIHEDGSGGLTYFTKVLTDIVRDGIPGAPAELTLADIHQELADRFRALTVRSSLDRPEPTRLFQDSADRFVFARNAAPAHTHRAVATRPTSKPPEPNPALDRQLARLRRTNKQLGGAALAAGAALGVEYAAHHHDVPDSSPVEHDSHVDATVLDDGGGLT